MAAGWSLLPSNLVDSVALLLSAADQARMAATCKLWKQAMADGFCRGQRKPSLWITLASFIDQGDHHNLCEFQSFSENIQRKYVFPMPFIDASILGSSQGWLMLKNAAGRIHAYNPITKDTLSFPVSGTVKKAVIARPDDLPVMAVIIWQAQFGGDGFTMVAMAKPGDDAWTYIRSPMIDVTDIAICRGTLYGVNWGNRVIAYDLRRENLASLSDLSLPTTVGLEVNYHPDCRNHLGFISDWPVLVRSWTYLSPWFEVFSLDTTGHVAKWVNIKDLDGHAILIGFEGIMVLHAAEFEELEADCVYCLDREGPCIEPGLIVMNVNTGAITIEPIPIPFTCLPFWFLPNPDREIEIHPRTRIYR